MWRDVGKRGDCGKVLARMTEGSGTGIWGGEETGAGGRTELVSFMGIGIVMWGPQVPIVDEGPGVASP